MPTPEEIAAQQAAADAAAAQAAAAAAAQNGPMDVDLFDGVKVTLPKEQAQKVIAARDALKANAKPASEKELKEAKEALLALQAQHATATQKIVGLETQIPELQKRNTDLTVKVTTLEADVTKAAAADATLTSILEAKLAAMPENMRPLVKGATTIEKIQSFEELVVAGVFKPVAMSPRKPAGGGGGVTMTVAEFNALPQQEQARVQQLLQSKQMPPLILG